MTKSHTSIHSKELKSVPDKVQESFWYKGHGVLMSGLPSMISGGVDANNAGDALEKVKKMSELWAYKALHSIHVYKLDLGGEVLAQPEIMYNASAQSLTPKDWSHVLG